MKRWIAFGFVVLLAAGALMLTQQQKVDAPVSPAALLRWIAGAERELSRVPASTTRLSDGDEIQIGNRLAQKYSARFAAYGPNDPVAAAYVERVGLQLASHAHRKLPFSFHYIPDANFANAFALPGGHVFIGQGLVKLMDSEDELAAVLAHEIEHIDHYHCAERVETTEAFRTIPLGGLIGIPVEVFEAGYSKDQELEADREGTRLAIQAGYSPLAAIRMLKRVERLHRRRTSLARTIPQEICHVALQTLSGYFASHPPTAERIAQIRMVMAETRRGIKASEQNLNTADVFKKGQPAVSAKSR